jgi:hypothetical protein
VALDLVSTRLFELFVQADFGSRAQLTWRRTQLLVLGAVPLYQLLLLYQLQHRKPLGIGVKSLLRAA